MTPTLARHRPSAELRQWGAIPVESTTSMRHRVTLIPGEGIGPEVAQAARRIIEAAGVDIEWEEASPRARSEAGSDELAYAGVVESVRRNRVGLKGPIATEIGFGAPSINVGLRKALE